MKGTRTATTQTLYRRGKSSLKNKKNKNQCYIYQHLSSFTMALPEPASGARAERLNAKSKVPKGVRWMFDAILNNDADTLNSFLEEGYNPNASNEAGEALMIVAITHRRLEIFRCILSSRLCDPNLTDHTGSETPLHIICRSLVHPTTQSTASDPKVDLTVTHDNALDQPPSSSSDGKGQFAVDQEHHTIDGEYGILKMMAYDLIRDPRTELNVYDQRLFSPLMHTCINNCPDIALELVLRGTEVNVPTLDHTYPLHVACEHDWIELARVLVEAGAADVNVVDHEGMTPLHLAALNNSMRLCRLLIHHGANIRARNKQNKLAHAFTQNTELRHILKGMYTSSTHPLQIDFIKSDLLGDARIGMSMCPGRNKRRYRRTLESDIDILVQHKVDVLISLIQDSELESMEIPDMIQKVRDAGIDVLHAPIPDKWIPSSMKFLTDLVDNILTYISESKCIVIHCNGGKGRTGLVVVTTLVTLGMEPREATQLIRSVRDGMLYNPAQMLYIRAYKLNLKPSEDGYAPVPTHDKQPLLLEAGQEKEQSASSVYSADGDDSGEEENAQV